MLAKYFNEDAMNAKILESCQGQTQCTPEVYYTDFWADGVTMPPYAILFAQIGCTADDEYLEMKGYWGLACSVIGLFMCIYWRITVTHK